MEKEIKVSASILCADFLNLGNEIKKCEDAGVDLIHVDVMDGHFVPNLTIGALIIKAIRPITRLPIEAHLMVENPGAYLDDFINAGADILCVHAECYGPLREGCRLDGQFPKEVDAVNTDKAREDIGRIKEKGKKVFMTLNPGTPQCLGPLLKEIDGVLVMSVNPGFAKQKFMPAALSKIQELRRIYEGDIAVDGGINASTAPEAVKAGANILVTASYFFQSDKPKESVRCLKSLGAA